MASRKSDPLAVYKAKRDFARTPEPGGKHEAAASGHRFIVQKHAATRLHWDFRLEADGVLKSWAVTRGPSSDPADKRLAVRTEDHPLEYAEFEGTIPKGEYGGGTVMLWDQGSWAPLPGKSADDIAEGHLHFTLAGQRMKGEWILIRLKPKPGEKRENWLLRKVEDAYAGAAADLVERCLTSVLTGRTMAEIAGDPGGEHARAGKQDDAFLQEMRKTARHNAGKVKAPTARSAKRKPPAFRKPQLATLTDAVPAGSDWMHEIKFDGYRALIAAAGPDIHVFTRNGLDWTDKFGPLVAAFQALDLPPCLIDGEITAPGADGNPSFSALQVVLKRGHGAQAPHQHLDFHGFDLLEVAGEDLGLLPNIERKARLEALLQQATSPIHVADHVIGEGEALLSAMCRAGQEGIIAKRIDAAYRGTSTQNWLKIKCGKHEEFLIVGWTRSKAKTRSFSSLLIAQQREQGLAYNGKVGTGFTEEVLADLAGRMAKLERKTAPLPVPAADARGVTWLKPELIADVRFAEFTAEHRVRHASFLGLRSDKPAREAKPKKTKTLSAPDTLVKITHRERAIFPESGETKGELADYYAAIAKLLLAYAAERPISLVRCPQGAGGKCFFQKHDSGALGDHLGHVPIAESDGKTEDYLYLRDAQGILECVQMGTIEFHGWGSRVAAIERPDRMIFDLDPDAGLGFAEVRKAALHLRDRLSELGLVSFAMLSGGKGVHVVVPLSPGHSWDAHKDFAHRFAEALSLEAPERFLATMSKAKRKGKIFIDWLRNQRGATAVVPYSARARAGAGVAAPVGWDELNEIESPARWTIRDSDELLDRARASTLIGWGLAEQSLPMI
jgi:bifunctional non-homologous end joining protein LigD